MTTRPTDDPLPRDPRFDAAWRAASNEEPPPALDAAILAAAHREVDAKPQSLSARAAMHARRRWWPLAAAATVAVIAIGVVQRAGHDDLVAPPSGNAVVSDLPAQSAKRSGAPAPLPEPFPAARTKLDQAAARDAPASAAGQVQTAAVPDAGAQRQEQTPSVPSAAPSIPSPATPTPSASPMPPPASFAESARVGASAPLRPSPAARSAAGAPARLEDRAPLPVADWIALIRRLRGEGNIAEAARELAAFRTAHADHERLLPPDLRDWHPIVNNVDK